MWLELKIKDYNCPNCNKEFNESWEFEELDSESIDDATDSIACACGCQFKIQAFVETMYHVVTKPQKTPDAGDNQLNIF